MNDTATRELTAILADIDSTQPGTWTASSLKNELEIAVRRQLAPLPEGEAGRMAAEAEHAARTMAPPVPDVTVNGSYTVRAVMPGHPAGGGLLESWWVAAEDPERGAWVTWGAYKMDGPRAGFLAYNAGHYFTGPDPAANKREALADLADRAGLLRDVALRIAAEITRYEHSTTPAARRAASYLHRWASR